MKVLAINGSMKSKEGCTDKILQPFLKGMQKAGAETETIYLANKKINHCAGCMSCWFTTPGQCVIEDDMAEILNKALAPDWVIYATPVYFRSTTGLMKDFLDRTIPLGIPQQATRYWTEVKKFLIAPCGFPDFEEFKLLVDLFKKAFPNTYMGEILRPAAELMHFDKFKSHYEKYRYDLEKAGVELIENGSISDETKLELNRFWIPPQDHFSMFEEMMKK